MKVRINQGRKHSEYTKKLLSEKRKQWLQENPEKHVWKRNDKFQSKPCENVKRFLKDFGIKFLQEYTPEGINRSFSIDIAIPDKKVALEVNGNQHYESDGKLKSYYKERQEILESIGWTVYQIHYSACYDSTNWKTFLEEVKNSPTKVDFDYFKYVPKQKKGRFDLCSCGGFKRRSSLKCINCVKTTASAKRTRQRLQKKPRYDLCSCGSKKESKSKVCNSCNRKLPKLYRRKVKRPSKEVLEKLIWEVPLTKISEMFNVSDVAVKKWCKTYGINNFPGRGYWRKVECGTPIQNRTGNMAVETPYYIRLTMGAQ